MMRTSRFIWTLLCECVARRRQRYAIVLLVSSIGASALAGWPWSPLATQHEIERHALSIEQHVVPDIASNEPLDGRSFYTIIEVDYPRRLRSNQAGPVVVRLQHFRWSLDMSETPSSEQPRANVLGQPLKLSPINHAPREFTVQLSGTQFDIEGSSLSLAGERYPIRFSWDITPQAAGLYAIIFDFSDVIQQPDFAVGLGDETIVRIDGVDQPLRNRTLRREIDVATPWGVSEIAVNVIAGLLALSAFLLQYPITIAWIFHILRKKDVDHTSIPDSNLKKNTSERDE